MNCFHGCWIPNNCVHDCSGRHLATSCRNRTGLNKQLTAELYPVSAVGDHRSLTIIKVYSRRLVKVNNLKRYD